MASIRNIFIRKYFDNPPTETKIWVVTFKPTFFSRRTITEVIFEGDGILCYAITGQINIDLKPITVKNSIDVEIEDATVKVFYSFEIQIIKPEENSRKRTLKYYPEIDKLKPTYGNDIDYFKGKLAETISSIIIDQIRKYSLLQLYFSFQLQDQEEKVKLINFAKANNYLQIQQSLSTIASSSIKNNILEKIKLYLDNINIQLNDNYRFECSFNEAQLQTSKYSFADYNIMIEDLEAKRRKAKTTTANLNLKEITDEENQMIIDSKDKADRQKEELEKRENISLANNNKILNDRLNIDKEKNDIELKLQSQNLMHKKEVEENNIKIGRELIVLQEEFYKDNRDKEFIDFDSLVALNNKKYELIEKDVEKKKAEIEAEINEIDVRLKILPLELEGKMNITYQAAIISLEISKRLAQQELLLNFSKFDAKQREELIKTLGGEIQNTVKGLTSTNQNMHLYNLSTGNLLEKIFSYFTNGDSHNTPLWDIFNVVKDHISPASDLGKSNTSNSNDGSFQPKGL